MEKTKKILIKKARHDYYATYHRDCEYDVEEASN